ncbi:MAG: hypothetical protein H6821_01115 [Planctomycetaceae bacterium]|nr:hypothetical protein [Planctomycetales bacterium]MCB9872751.1 hypothetical protein [Planctomycetaceae bacterium]MCB9926237.1 hypothetical protein [Planctomycetaceae bacterium]
MAALAFELDSEQKAGGEELPQDALNGLARVQVVTSSNARQAHHLRATVTAGNT